MSDPWLKVWAADMRGDPELALLGLAGQALLMHAWDIARDESTTYGELRRADGAPYTPQTFTVVVPGADLRTVRSWWTAILSHGYAAQTSDGALFFPKLEQRQRGSAGAIRQARYRSRNDHRQRDAQRHDPRHRVTPSVTHNETAEARSQRLTSANADVVELDARRGDVDKVWQEYASRHPRARLTTPRRGLIRRRLKDYPVDVLIAAIKGNHLDSHCNGDNPRGQTYHDLELILRDAAHVERYSGLVGAEPTETELERACRWWTANADRGEEDLRGVWGDDIAEQVLDQVGA